MQRNTIKKRFIMTFAVEKTSRISLGCKLVPVHTGNTNMTYYDKTAFFLATMKIICLIYFSMSQKCSTS